MYIYVCTINVLIFDEGACIFRVRRVVYPKASPTKPICICKYLYTHPPVVTTGVEDAHHPLVRVPNITATGRYELISKLFFRIINVVCMHTYLYFNLYINNVRLKTVVRRQCWNTHSKPWLHCLPKTPLAKWYV